VLARDIYRDLYEEPGPSFEEKLFLAGKRLGITIAACALGLGVLDFAGIHSIPGVNNLLQLSRTKVASLAPRHSTTQSPRPSGDEVRVAIPKSPSVPRPRAPQSPALENLAAVRSKDAVTLAMTTPSIAPAALIVAPAAQPPVVLQATTATAPPATSPAAPALSEIAAKSHASVPPEQEFKLASLPSPEIASASPILTAPAPNAPVAIPLSEVPLPRAAPPMSPADRLGLKDKDYARAERCLANAIYFEARSEPIRGQMAVAQVVLNRVFSGFYPNDICGVVYQNANRHLACQFTFACDGKRKLITERGHWAVANRIARQTLDGQIYVPEVGKSTHYHASYVHPNWVREMKKLVRFGVHSFYRPYAWGNGSEEPVWGSGATLAHVQKTAAR
jgi:hypothetical protein